MNALTLSQESQNYAHDLIRKWKYPEFADEMQHTCYDCGLEYGCDAWADIHLPDDIWELINPSVHEGGGLLCFNCITRRLGLTNVKIDIYGSPYPLPLEPRGVTSIVQIAFEEDDSHK